MKTRCALTAVFLGVLTMPGTAESQVNIPDENLKQAVKETLGIEYDPNESEMLSLTTLFASERSITDLTGLEYATQMRILSLGKNNISDISALAGLTKLDDLSLSSNDISNVSAIGGLSNLSGLGIDDNQISDISPLAELTNLTYLSLSDNDISDISALGGLTNLTGLYLANNDISDISTFSGLTGLNVLYLAKNQISDISVIGDLDNLNRLYLFDNEISDISVLGKLTNLTFIHLFGNDISDISSLVNLSNLDHLNLRLNPLDTLAYTQHIPEIRVNNPEADIFYDDPVVILDMDNQLEVRGRAYCITELCEPGAYQLESISSLEGELYIFERLVVAPNVTVHLVDNFRDHPEFPFDVLYVKTLVLGSGSTLNLASERLYYEALQGDPNQIVSQPLYTSVIGYMDFTDENEFKERVTTNNDSNLTFAGPIYERFPDPTGALYLQTLQGEPARAKTFMGRFSGDEVTISLNYLFDRAGPEVSMGVYLSDKPQLLPLDDPDMLELGRILPPPPSFPGSVGSGRYGTFELDVDVSALETEHGLWLEVILSDAPVIGQNPFTAYMESAGSRGMVDDMWMGNPCLGICMDLDKDNVVTVHDYHLVTAGSGRSKSACPKSVLPCIDRGFSRDGYAEAGDIRSWSHAFSPCSSLDNCMDYCSFFSLDSFGSGAGSGGGSGTTMSMMLLSMDWLQDFTVVNQSSTLLLLGKGEKTVSTFFGPRNYVGHNDLLYEIDENGDFVPVGNGLSSRTGVRLVKDDNGTCYVIDSKAGILTLDGGPVIEPDTIKSFENKTVYIGLQDSNGNLSGRPILDAAFDEDDIYIVPVMVEESGRGTYLAAARLEQNGSGYAVKELFYDQALSDITRQNPNLNGLREIEVDSEGYVYVLNVHRQNESDLLWCFESDGTLVNSIKFNCPKGSQDSACLGTSIPDPVGLCYDPYTDHLYVASGIFDPNKPHQSLLYTLNAQTLDIVGPNTIGEIQHVTDITTNGKGKIWITGFNLPYNPDDIYGDDSDLYAALPEPVLIDVPVSAGGVGTPEEISLAQMFNMTVPMSILWIEP